MIMNKLEEDVICLTNSFLKVCFWLKDKTMMVIICIALISSNASAFELGTNLVKNPSFEEKLNSTTNALLNWGDPTSRYNGVLDSSTTYNGNYSYKLVTDSKTEEYSWVRSSEIEVIENKNYLIRTHIKAENAQKLHIKLEAYYQDDNLWDDSFAWIAAPTENTFNWKEFCTFIKIPKDITKVRFILQAGYVNDRNSGNATTWFDDIEFIDPDVVNPTKYETELSLNRGESWQINDDFALFLEDTTRESAVMSLIFKGIPLSNQIVNKGEYATFEYNESKLLIFRLDNIYNSTDMGKVLLKEVLAGTIPSENILAPKLDISVSSPDHAFRGSNVTLNVSVTNKGEMAFTGDVELTAKLGERSLSEKEKLNLVPSERKNYSFNVVAPEKPDGYKITGILKTRYSSLKDEGKIQVKALNPVVTTLSPDIREDNGIRGTITIGSAFSDELVEWNTKSNIEVFKVLGNGKQQIYSKEVPVKGRVFDIAISYDEFYRDDGRYLVTIKAGEMKNDMFFEIKGPDGEYIPPKEERIPPTIVSNAVYPQLMLLLIGMVAALSLRNHMFPRKWSLPLDLVTLGSGAFLFGAGMLKGQDEVIIKGMVFAGTGFGVLLARGYDLRIDTLLLHGSPIHDFIGLVMVFLSATYLVLLIPEWNIMLIMGTLIVYYTLINLHGGRTQT